MLTQVNTSQYANYSSRFQNKKLNLHSEFTHFDVYILKKNWLLAFDTLFELIIIVPLLL